MSAKAYTQDSYVTMNLTLVMEDDSKKTLSITEGDIISDLVFKDPNCGCIRTITGRVKSINFKTKTGETGKEICPHDTESVFNNYFTPTSLTIDFSDEYTGNVMIIPLAAIKDFNDHVVKGEDEKTGVSIVTDPNAVPETTELIVSVEFSADETTAIEKDILKYDEGNTYELYDIKLSNEGEVIQPDGNVVVIVPLNEDKLKECDYVEVRHVLEDGTYETVPCSIEGDKLSFLTNKFSYFVVVYMKNPVYTLKQYPSKLTKETAITSNGGTVMITDGNTEGSTTIICGEDTMNFTAETKKLVFSGSEDEKNVKSVDIQVTGGSPYSIYGTGGHYTIDGEYVYADNVTMNLTGGKIYNSVGGAGAPLAYIKNVDITMAGTASASCVFPGVLASISKVLTAGTADKPDGGIVENGTVTAKGNSKIAYLYGGGQSYSTVVNSIVNVEDDAGILEIVGGGSNGHSDNVEVNINGGTVFQNIIGVNRGTAKNVVYNINGGKIGCTDEEINNSSITYLNYTADQLPNEIGLFLGTVKNANNTIVNAVTESITLNYHDGDVEVYFGTDIPSCPMITLNADKELVIKMTTGSGRYTSKSPVLPHNPEAGQEIYVNDNVILEIPEGITVNNMGRIVTTGSGKVVVKGTLTGNEVEGTVERVESSTPVVTE